MNQRIQELVRQAMSIVMNGNDPDGDVEQIYIPAEFTKKFAQLIVAECIGKIELEAVQYAEPVWAFEIVDDIREHFGIEQ